MKKLKRKSLVLTLTITFALLGVALGQTGEVQAQGRVVRVNDRQVEQIIASVERRSDRFRRSFDAALDRSRLDGTYTEDSVNEYVKAFENATNNLRSRFNARSAASADVENVLTSAAVIDQFMRTNLRQPRVQGDWTLLKGDLQRLANAYSVAFNFNGRVLPPNVVATQRAYRVSDATVETILRRVETKSDSFRTTLDQALDRSRLNNTNREDNISAFVSDFENSTDALRRKFDGRTSVAVDVSNILVRAARIDDFMRRNLRRETTVQRNWQSVRSDLNLLANYYNLAFNLDNRRGMPAYTAIGIDGIPTTPDALLTGTYRLDKNSSDIARTVAELAARTANRNNRERIIDNLVRRLRSPEMLSIDRSGRRFMLASSFSPRITLDADGLEHLESYPNGRASRVRANLSSDTLTIVSNGDRANDFSVVFNSLDGGARMMVTRGVYLEGLNKAVEVRSYYDRTSNVAQFDIFRNDVSASTYGSISNSFILPPNTVITAVSNTMLSTKTSRDGDRFTMSVRSPSPYAGAVIEGYVSNASRSGRVAGRAEMNLIYETIRMPNNQTFRFAGVTENVRVGSGENVRIDNEGTLKENDSQTNSTVGRTAIGTGIGALLGALLGGGEGAAIGAAVGAGTGVGSVYVQGRDDLELPSGSEFTIRASAPGRG